MKTYRWKNGGRRFAMSPETAAIELERIRSMHGVLRAEDVVAEAKDPDNALHSVFEWDDTTAAENYRKEQARNLIRSVVVEVVDKKESEPLTVRAFVHLESAKGYAETLDALANVETREEVLSRARAEMQSWMRRYRHLEEYADLVGVWEKIAA